MSELFSGMGEAMGSIMSGMMKNMDPNLLKAMQEQQGKVYTVHTNMHVRAFQKCNVWLP